MKNSRNLYQFKDKDPIIDILRSLVETRATLEATTLHNVLKMIEDETHGEIKAATPYSWFHGPTRYPRYDTVARLYLAMRAYSRKPVSIGDKEVSPLNLLEKSRGQVA